MNGVIAIHVSLNRLALLVEIEAMVRRKKKFNLLWILMAVFALGGAVFLMVIGQDALNEQNPFQFYADSNTYINFYNGFANAFSDELLGVSTNYLGPLLVLTLLQGNIYLVMLLNVYLFTHSIIHIARLLGLDPLKVTLILLLSPLMISTLLSVNKEIFLFPFLAFALNGRLRNSMFFVLLALILSLLVRWQFMIFYFLIVFLSTSQIFDRGRVLSITTVPIHLMTKLTRMPERIVVFVVLLLGISVVYPAIKEWIEPIIASVELSNRIYEGGGSGLFEFVGAYQDLGLYFLLFPVKAFHLLFGMGLKVDKILSPEDIYNDLFVGGHCAVALIVFLVMIKRRLLTMRSDLVFASLVFLAVFCVTPIFGPRYLFFAYIMWVLVLSGAPLKLTPQSKWPTRWESSSADELTRPVRTGAARSWF
jgi:hypothetical protein